MSNQFYREMTLEEVARSRGYMSLPYRQYAELIGKVSMLESLEKTLREACSNLPVSMDYRPPEMELFQVIINLKNKIDALEGKTYHKLGVE